MNTIFLQLRNAKCPIRHKHQVSIVSKAETEDPDAIYRS